MYMSNGNVKYLALFSDMLKKYQETCKKTLEGYSFTPNETAMMVYMLRNPKVDTAKDIAAQLGISQSLICRSVDSLTTKGLLSVKKDSDDRRVNHLSLTLNDDKLRRMLMTMDNSFENELVSGLQDEELDVFSKVVGKMATNIGIA